MQFVGNLFASVSEFYKDINPSTLSGAIDIIVIEDTTTGQRRCTPWHVRFGKLQLLRASEKRVEICINGERVDCFAQEGGTLKTGDSVSGADTEKSRFEDGIAMKVGVGGETYFVLPVEEEQLHGLSVDLLTSPLSKVIDADKVKPMQIEPSTDKTKDITIIKDNEEDKTAGGDSTTQAIVTSVTEKVTPENDARCQSEAGHDDKSTTTTTATKQHGILSDSEVEVRRKESKEVLLSDSTAPKDPTLRSSASPWSWMWGSASALKEPFPIAPAAFTLESRLYEYYEALETASVLKYNYSLLRTMLLNHLSIDIKLYRLDRGLFVKSSTEFATQKALVSILTSNAKAMDYTTFTTCLPVECLDQMVVQISAQGYHALLPADAGMMILSTWMLFHRMIDEGEVSKLVGEKETSVMVAPTVPPAQKIGWRQWWSSRRKEQVKEPVKTRLKEEIGVPIPEPRKQPASPPEPILSPPSVSVSSPALTALSDEDLPSTGARKKYIKSLRLPPGLLAKLPLKKGSNTVTFTVTTKLQGRASCQARIFLLPSTTRIVVSDIDGTITRSDALGHFFTIVGKDWTHSDVAVLYTHIARNGYQMVYLTSRAIGQASYTRGYLSGITQKDFQLPDGPLIMSPDRLFQALHREVIVGNPEEFKIATLQDIQRQFPASDQSPFYAGFGNRSTDARAYLSVGIPAWRIFTINPSGSVNLEHARIHNFASYGKLVDLVDAIFPPLSFRAPLNMETFGDFGYWRASADDLMMQGHLVQVLQEAKRKGADPLMILPPEAMDQLMGDLGDTDLTAELLPGDLEYYELDEAEDEGDAALYEFEYFGQRSRKATKAPPLPQQLKPPPRTSVPAVPSPHDTKGVGGDKEGKDLDGSGEGGGESEGEEVPAISKYPY